MEKCLWCMEFLRVHLGHLVIRLGNLEKEFWFGNGSFSGCHGGLWWLIMGEEDDEVVVNIWREFIGRE
ncbi:hypothetical protein Tco_0173057 [Tanacetum coccineum]